MLSQSNLYTRSVLSSSVKREVLWNVVEPGDPYDIKKSMIARLPRDKRIAMGEHLDLVCLLQAAQIERLCEFLEDYKLKFRQVERATLDRHSYEVQIKELTVEIAENEAYKADSNKLRDFIKKQSTEIQNLQKNYRDARNIDGSLKIATQKSAEKLAQLTIENQKLMQINEDYRLQVQTFNARIQAFERAKNKEIEELRFSSAQYSKESIQNTLNIQRFQYQGQARRLEFQLKRLKEAYDQKVNEAASLKKTNQDYVRELAIERGKGESAFILERKSLDYEKRLSYATSEIERLNINLREINSKFQESELRKRELERRIEKDEFQIKDYEGKLRMSGNQINHLKEVIQKLDGQARKVGESRQYIIQYEAKIQEMAREKDLMNSKITQEANNSQRLKEELDKLLYQNSKYKLIERENSQLKEGLIERDNLKRKAIELQNSVTFLKQQLDRSTGANKNKDSQLQRYRAIAFENEGLKAKIKEVQYVLTNKYENELVRVKSENQQRIQYITRTKGNQFQLKAQTYEKESQRLRDLLKAKSDESQKLRARVYELQNYINRFQIQTSSKVKNFENNFAQIRKQNQELYLKSRKLEQTQRRLYQLQNKNANIERQIERLTNLIKNRQEELFGLKARLRDTEGYNQKYELDVSRKITGYEQNINAIRAQNEELRKKINEFATESNKRLNDSAQEINKLNTIIRNMNEQKTQFDFRWKQITQQNDNLKQNLQKVNKNNEELRAKLMEAEAKYSNYFNESSFNSKRFITQNQVLKKQLNDYQISITNFEAEVNKRIMAYDQNIAALVKENEELKRRIRQLQVQSANLKQQLDFTIKKLKTKQQEASFIETNYKNVLQQLENAKRFHQQYQISVKNRFEGEVNNKYANYEQSVQNLRTENENMRKKIIQLQTKFAQLAQQYERITLNLRNSMQENDSLKKQLSQKDNLANNFQADVKVRITNYESNIQNLIRINEELQNNLSNNVANLNKKIEQLRQLEEKYRLLNNQFEALQRNYSNLQITFKNKIQGEVVNRYNNYEEVIGKLNEQRNQLRKQLQQASKQNTEIIAHINQILAQNQILRRKIDNYQTSIAAYEAQVSKRFVVYEQNIEILTKQREQLIKKLQEGGDTTRKLLIESQNKLKNANQELERSSINFRQSTQRQAQQLRRKIQDINELQRRLGDLQGRFSFSNQQIERLALALKTKHDEINKLELKILNQNQQIDAFKRQCNDLQIKFSQTYEFEVVNKYNTYELNITELKKQLAKSQQKNQGISQQLERLSNQLRSKTDESSQVASSIRSISVDYEEFKRRARQNQTILNQNSNSVKRENQELRKKLFESERFGKQLKDESDRRIAECENKIRVMGQQIQRLNEVIKGKGSQIEILRKNLMDYEYSFNQTMDFQQKNKSLQQALLANLTKENEELKRRLSDSSDANRKIAEVQNRLQIASQENERINMVLKGKIDQLARSQAANRGLSNDLELLKRNNQDLNEFSRAIADYEQRIGLVIQENQKLQFALRSKTDALTSAQFRIKELSVQNQQLRRQIQDNKLNWNKTSDEINRKTANYEQNAAILARQREDFSRKKAEYESKIAILNQQIQRLNISYRSRMEEWQRAVAQVENLRQLSQKKIQVSQNELINWQSNFKSISSEYQNAKKHLQEYETNIKRLHQEFQRLQSIINDLKRQRQTLIQKNHALSEEINRLRSQNQDLQAQTKEVRLQLTNESSLQKRINEHMALMVILFAQIESLRTRVADKEKEVEDVRRRSLSPNIL